MSAAVPRLQGILFDLDGTLVDSAPDLAGTADDMREARGLPPLGLAVLRPHCGSGARGMLGCAFGLTPADAAYGRLRDEFHDRYEARLLHATRPFDAAIALLQSLQQRGLGLGIVTNKAMRFAQPLAEAFGLLPAGGVLVAGDSTPHTKPHPAPLLEAARRLGLPPAQLAYVGDDARDIVAGRAAGMRTVAAAWGYLGAGAAPQDWGADQVLPGPDALLHWLDLA